MKTLLSILLHNAAQRPKISSPNQQRLLLSTAGALTLLLSGCSGSGSGGDDFDTVPGSMMDYQIKILATEPKVDLQLVAHDNSNLDSPLFTLKPSEQLRIDFKDTSYGDHLVVENPPVDKSASYQQIYITGGPDSNMLFSADDQEGDDIIIWIENGVIINAAGSHHLYQLYGNATDNIFSGGVNNDLLAGAEGDDELYGDEGDDNLYGGEGNDTLYGEGGDDNLYGDAEGDWFGGVLGEGDGNDTLYGQDGDDNLYGHAGDDWLAGGLGENVLDGGVGIDTAGFPGTFNDYTIAEVEGSDSYLVTQNKASSNSPNSSDTLSNIEILEFSDRTCILPHLPEWLKGLYEEVCPITGV